MWVALNNAFLSIVAHRAKPDILLVRARLKGDIESVFPNASVFTDTSADYRYRAEIPRGEVGAALAAIATTINYDNFKASVHDPRRHAAYMDVWSTMQRLQRD
jgi:hypothetical protein